MPITSYQMAKASTVNHIPVIPFSGCSPLVNSVISIVLGVKKKINKVRICEIKDERMASGTIWVWLFCFLAFLVSRSPKMT